MKKISYLLLYFFILLSCNKDGNMSENKMPIIDVDTENIIFTNDLPGSATLSVTTNLPWTLEIGETMNTDSWFEVTPKSGGAGSNMITINLLKANEAYDDRNAIVKLKVGTTYKSVTISQKKKDALLLTQDKYNVSPDGGSFMVEVKSNVTYQIAIHESCKDWISQSIKTKSLVTNSEYFSVSSGDIEGNREGIIVFSSGALKDTVHVFQTQKNAIILNSKIKNIDFTSQSFDVDLRTNVDYSVTLLDDKWIHQLPITKSTRVDKLGFVADENVEYENRSMRIVFKDKNSLATDTLKVNQGAKNALILSNKVLQINHKGGELSAELKANITYDIIIPSDANWITRSDLKSLSLFTHKFNVAPNSTNNNRKTNIIFKDINSSLADTLVVLQTADNDRSALMAIYNSTGGSNWKRHDNWGSNKPLGEWYGVSTGISFGDTPVPEGQVSGLRLDDNNLTGEIPADIFKLNLQSLYLRENPNCKLVHVPSADELMSWQNLCSLDLEYFNVNQGFVNKICEFSNLRFLTLYISPVLNPGLRLTLDDRIGKLTKLEGFSLDQVDISFSDCFDHLKKLKRISFTSPNGSNNVSGVPPLLTDKIWSLPDLEYLYLFLYKLNITPQIGNLTKLKVVDMYGMNIIGELPPEIGNCTNLTEFSIKYGYNCSPGEGRNFITTGLKGILPSELGKLTKLEKLCLPYNDLSGSIPEEVAKLPNLKSLVLNYNRLSGVIPEKVKQHPNWELWDAITNIYPQQTGYGFSVSLEQSTDFSEDGKMFKIQSASRGKGIDIVIVGDGFIDSEIGSGKVYDNTMIAAKDYFLNIEPYLSYKDYFNIYYLRAVSPQKGMSTNDFVVNTKFGVKNVGGPQSTALEINTEKIRNFVADKGLDNSRIIVISNSKVYAGTCHMTIENDKVNTIAICTLEEMENALHHEANGHGFGLLADEYVTKFGVVIPQDIKDNLKKVQSQYQMYPNIDFTKDLNTIKWAKFITMDKYSPYVGAFEGANYYSNGVWRPEISSCMIDNIAYFNAPSREAIVKQIKMKAGESFSWNEFVANDNVVMPVITKSAKINRPHLAPPIIEFGSR